MSAPKMVASVPEPTSLAEELLDQVVAFRPICEEAVETQMGSSVATLAQVVTVDDGGRPQDRGEVPVFWQVVRAQLRATASEQVPWVAGVFTKEGRAYRLRPLTAAQSQSVESALANLSE